MKKAVPCHLCIPMSAVSSSTFSTRDLRYFRLNSRPTNPMPALLRSPRSINMSFISAVMVTWLTPKSRLSTTMLLAAPKLSPSTTSQPGDSGPTSVSSNTDVGDHSATDRPLHTNTHRVVSNIHGDTGNIGH